MADSVRYFDGKKFMWDGSDYPDRSAAKAKADEYAAAGFEVKVFEDAGASFVYTRRVAQSPAPSS